MLCSVDVAPRVRHVVNIFTPFPLRSVGVWFSSTFPHKSAPLSFAYDSFKSDFHLCSPLVSSSNFGFFLQATLPKASRLKYPHQSSRLAPNKPQTPKRTSQPPQPASQTIRTNSIHISRTSPLQQLPPQITLLKIALHATHLPPPTTSASNNSPQNRFTRHAIPLRRRFPPQITLLKIALHATQFLRHHHPPQITPTGLVFW